MNTRVTLSTAVVTLSLIAAACSPATPRPATKAPAVVPTLKAPTAAPVKPTTAPAKPTIAPPKPTVKPTEKSTVAPTLAPTLAPTTAPGAIGTSQMVGALQITPSAIKTLTSAGTDKPKSGDVYLSVEILIKNTSKTDALTVDPAMLSLVGATGSPSYAALTLKSMTNELTAQSIKPGASLSAVVVFEAPKNTQGLQLKFHEATYQAIWALGA